jgi:hypothetical protein
MLTLVTKVSKARTLPTVASAETVAIGRSLPFAVAATRTIPR